MCGGCQGEAVSTGPAGEWVLLSLSPGARELTVSIQMCRFSTFDVSFSHATKRWILPSRLLGRFFFVRINEMGLIKHLGEKHCIDHCIWMMLLRQLLWNRKNKAPCAAPTVYLSILPLPGLGLLYPQATIWPLWIHWTVSQLKQVPAGEREDRCRLPVPRHLIA